jgi:hypothetical protein
MSPVEEEEEEERSLSRYRQDSIDEVGIHGKSGTSMPAGTVLYLSTRGL